MPASPLDPAAEEARRLRVIVAAFRSFGFNVEGFLHNALMAEKAFLDSVGGERPEGAALDAAIERHLRADEDALWSPTVQNHLDLLRAHYVQGGLPGGPDDDADPERVRARLSRLCDAVALRPASGSRGGKPALPRAITHWYDGFHRLREDLREILGEALWHARKAGALTNREAIGRFLEGNPAYAERVLKAEEKTPRIAERLARSRWLFQEVLGVPHYPNPRWREHDLTLAHLRLVGALEWLRVHGYAAQRLTSVAEYLAASHLAGIVGDLSSPAAQRRLRGLQPRAKRRT